MNKATIVCGGICVLWLMACFSAVAYLTDWAVVASVPGWIVAPVGIALFVAIVMPIVLFLNWARIARELAEMGPKPK